MRDTEFVSAGKIEEGDELPRYGTVTRVLNDSAVIAVDTTQPPYGFIKSQHAPIERYVRTPGQLYGLEWLHRHPPEATCAGSVVEEDR
jgi:hypothetical protein